MGLALDVVLVDDSPQGMIVVDSSNWRGIATSCPRTTIQNLKGRREAQHTGIYFLWGPDPELENEVRVYVGEGVNIWDRVSDHLQKKEWWKRVIIVSSNSMSHGLSKSHIQFLESISYSEINRIGLATTKQNEPKMPTLKESDQIICETFYEGMLNVLPIIGFPFLNPIAIEVVPDSDAPGYLFEVKSEAKGVSARAVPFEGGIMILAGSTASKDDTPSWTGGKEKRNQLIKDGALEDNGECLEFTRNVPLNSPSMASNIVLARQTPGPITWKEVRTGQTWKEIFSQDSE